MRLTMDLNHRYALDGRDPCSYGGVLWCLGLFDRPFQPAGKVFGKVRERPCESHQSRLDMKKFAASVDRPIAGRMPKIAMVGAGVGGLIASRCLQDHGIDVTLFDKSQGVGGRDWHLIMAPSTSLHEIRGSLVTYGVGFSKVWSSLGWGRSSS